MTPSQPLHPTSFVSALYNFAEGGGSQGLTFFITHSPASADYCETGSNFIEEMFSGPPPHFSHISFGPPGGGGGPARAPQGDQPSLYGHCERGQETKERADD